MKKCFLLPVLALCALINSRADVTLPPLISDHMVLQKSPSTRIWGTADPEEKVTVTLENQTVTCSADKEGNWRTSLDLSKSGPGPFEMKVEGKNSLTVSDVVVGEVWVASGQSNMEWHLLKTTGSESEIAASNNPLLRHFRVGKAVSPTPLTTFSGTWIKAAPDTAAGFSAVAYYFGKTLQNTLQVPVGLINSSWGGTPSEAWTSSEALDTDPDLKVARVRIQEDKKTHPKRKSAYVESFHTWAKQTQREDRPVEDVAAFASADANTTDWVKVALPGILNQGDLPSAGAVWVRQNVDIPASLAGKKLSLNLGVISGFDQVYWNGKLLAAMTPESLPEPGWPRRGPAYTIPAEEVAAGKNVLAIRVYNPKGPVQFFHPLKAELLSLGDQWLAKAEFSLPDLDAAESAAVPQAPAAPASSPHTPGYLFNAMIHPLLPATISGVIWYQGESNSSRAWQYRTAFPLMISDWREQWQEEELPFYFCQLANYTNKPESPGDSAWAELREAQSNTLSLPHTGQAVLIDIGETSNIHPWNKKDVGERLAKIALAKDYGQKIEFSGPVFEEAIVEGDKIRVKFSQTAGALSAAPVPSTQTLDSATNSTAPLRRNSPDSELEGFAICGQDQNWVWADAKIDGDTVLVWSKEVSEPVAVRYGWANNPTCNLINAAGLPASPFRSDDFPAQTRNQKL